MFYIFIYFLFCRLEGSCNHVAALLYALVDITDYKLKGLDAATSKQCAWNIPRKRRLSPKKASDVVLIKRQHLSEYKSSAVNQTQFAEKLKSVRTQCWLVTGEYSQTGRAARTVCINYTGTRFHVFRQDRHFIRKLQNSIHWFCLQVVLFRRRNLATQNATCLQSKCSLWHTARAGRLTSSYFGDICKRKKDTAPESLVRSILDYTTFSNKHTKWGLSHEPAARRRYVEHMKKTHPHIKVQPCGLIINKEKTFLACSPDGLVKCSHCQPCQGLLEIKCPSVHRQKTPEEACSDKTFFCELVEGLVTLKRNHNFYYQVQGQLGASGKIWCDFVVWTMKGMSVERIVFDEAFWKSMVEKLHSFYVNAIVPELFTHRIKRGKSLNI